MKVNSSVPEKKMKKQNHNIENDLFRCVICLLALLLTIFIWSSAWPRSSNPSMRWA